MKCICPIPNTLNERLKEEKETGIGYLVVAVELKNGTYFDQVTVSEGCIIEVRGFEQIPFAPEDIESIRINHKHWNFRDGSDMREKTRAAHQ